MDVRAYFQRIRQLEQELPAGDVVVISLSTADGGIEGRVMELDRTVAAKMIIDRRVRPATPQEVELYFEEVDREQSENESRFIEPKTNFIVAISEARKKIQSSKLKKESMDGTL